MTQYPLYGSINYRGKKKPEINKDLAEQGKEEAMKKYAICQVKASNTRQKFMCSSKDKIMYNGNCYQLITQSFHKDWVDIVPVISKTEFNRLMKMGVLGEPYKRKKTIEVTMYDFIVDK